MAVLQALHFLLMICCLIWKEGKVASRRVPRRDRKRIILFSKVVYSTVKPRAHRSPFFLKIIIHAARIMKSNAAFRGRVMLIWWRIRSLAEMNITEVAAISVQGRQQVLWQPGRLQRS